MPIFAMTFVKEIAHVNYCYALFLKFYRMKVPIGERVVRLNFEML